MLSCDQSTVQRIRETVSYHLGDLGVDRRDLSILEEAILRDGRREVGIRFRAGRMIALWDVESNRIRFYDNCACQLRSVAAR